MKFKIQIKYDNEILLYSKIGGWHLLKRNHVVPLILFDVGKSKEYKAYREKGGSKFFYKKKMDKQDVVEINKSFTIGKKELPL